MATLPHNLLRFGAGFELDPRAWELRQGGALRHLERLPMQILLLLIGRRGESVSRTSIVERIWGGQAGFDTHHSIEGAVHTLRATLGDDPAQPRFIQTESADAYRFIAPVTEAPAAPRPAAPAAASQAGEPLPPAPTRRAWLVGTVSLLVLAVETLFFMRLSNSTPLPPIVMLAVLPLTNLTGNPGEDYLSDGLTEELITQLGNVDPKHLGVIARTSVMPYKNTHESAGEIARALNVQYLLEGSVRRDGEKLRISAQLVRASDQAHVWAQQYDRAPASIFQLQDEIALSVAQELDGTLRPAAPQAKRTPASPAHDLYLQGRYHWSKRTEQGFVQALTLFQQATERDPRYAPAYAGLADTYAMMSDYGLSRPRETMPRARAAALKALELDADLAEAHTALAVVAQDFDFDFDTAEHEYRRALELNPGYATAHQWYAGCLAVQGRFAEALAESERALLLDPLSPVVRADHAVILHFARQSAPALEAFEAVLAMEPANGRAHMVIQALVQQGRLADALERIDEWRRVDPNPWQAASEAYVYGLTGDAVRASAALAEMERGSEEKGWDPLPMRAVAYLGLGDRERLLATLEQAYTQRANFVTALAVDPAYDPLREDPRFRDLLQRVGRR